MDAILRALVVYLFLLILFRVTGKRSLAQITAFDFVLLLVIGEVTEQSLVGDDYSMTKAGLVIMSLLGIDIGFSMLEGRFKSFGPWLNDVPLILVDEGQALERPMSESRISESDILEAARDKQGLERMDQIKYAVLERTGSISIVPKQQEST